MKRYEKVRKLSTGQGEDYTTGCLWDYNYIKIQNRLIAVDLNWQEELPTDAKTFQQIEIVGQL